MTHLTELCNPLLGHDPQFGKRGARYYITADMWLAYRSDVRWSLENENWNAVLEKANAWSVIWSQEVIGRESMWCVQSNWQQMENFWSTGKALQPINNNWSRDVNRKLELWFLVLKPKTSSISLATGFIKKLSFSSRKLHIIYQMWGKINSHIFLMLGVYTNFHQTVKYGRHWHSHVQARGGKCLLLLRLTNRQRPGFCHLLPLHLDVATDLPPLEIESGYAPAYAWCSGITYLSSVKFTNPCPPDKQYGHPRMRSK